MNQSDKRAALDRLYARLPTIRCQGKCQRYCGVVPMFAVEKDRIAERIGHTPDCVTPGDPLANIRSATCELLNTKTGRCTVYDIRPLICRAWGTIKDMACPHGCKPSRWMSDAEFQSICGKIRKLEERA